MAQWPEEGGDHGDRTVSVPSDLAHPSFSMNTRERELQVNQKRCA